MKTNSTKYPAVLASLVFSTLLSVCAQTQFSAWDLPGGVEGNREMEGGLGIGNDFEVVRPITIWSLGVFDHRGDGVVGSAVLRVQLYASNPDRARKRASGVLLETVSFDAADPGRLVGGFRYKALLRPVTLIPGQYTITAEGFDERNPVYRRADPSLLRFAGLTNELRLSESRTPVRLNDGGGLIRFTGCSHYHVGYFLKRTRTAKDLESLERKAELFGAATFVYCAAPQFDSPFAADYAALTAGVRSFPWDTNKSDVYGYHYGSISVLEQNAFPVIMEPSGNRMVFEAAGTYEAAGRYNGDPNGARCVAFSDEQWAYARDDARAVLFENAIRWASRKSNPAEIIIGLSGDMDAGYLHKCGYQVVRLNNRLEPVKESSASGLDVLVVDFHGPCSESFLAKAAAFMAAGGGMVITYSPWRESLTGNIAPLFGQINDLLKPFGLAYRSLFTQLNDLGFTNLPASAYPPFLFNAFPAAELLRHNRLGHVQLDSLQKALALHAISYAADGRPELLSDLAAVYAGATTNAGSSSGEGLGEFVDLVTLAGAQANTNRLGRWQAEGGELVSQDTRGSVEYDFEVGAGDIYRIQVYGQERLPSGAQAHLDLILSVDGIPLGQYSFQTPSAAGALLSLFAAKLGQQYNLQTAYGTSDKVECLTPFLLAGPHKLRILWNNSSSVAQLRLQRIQVQAPVGADADGDGVKDWVKKLVDYQSGLDLTNATLTSYVSPMCLEGRDPCPALMKADVTGADKSAPALALWPAPNGRWYVNVPLASSGKATFRVAYQNGAKSEVRSVCWLPVNVLNGGSYTLRDGDSLLLVARPEGSTTRDQGTMRFTIGTNNFTLSASAQMPCSFAGPRVASRTGIYGSKVVTVTGTYTSAGGVSQTGTITVNVVRNEFKNHPACWVGREREWELTLPTEASFEADQRLFVESLAELPAGGLRVGLSIDQSEPRFFLSRLGTNGPILHSGVAQGFDFWCANDTYLRTVKTFRDGSQLMEMLLIMNPVLPDVTVQLDVLIGGVVFEDGTTTKRLTQADFNAQGKCVLRFIRPATFKASVCHSITLLQGDAVVGKIW